MVNILSILENNIEKLYDKNINYYKLDTIKECLTVELTKNKCLCEEYFNEDGTLTNRCIFEYLLFVRIQRKEKGIYINSIDDIAISIDKFLNKLFKDINKSKQIDYKSSPEVGHIVTLMNKYLTEDEIEIIVEKLIKSNMNNRDI